MLDVIYVSLLLINQNILYIVKFVNAVVKDMIIIVHGLRNVWEKETFFIFMECLQWYLLFLLM